MKTALIKVRRDQEFKTPNWIHEPRGTLEERFEKAFRYFNRVIFVGSMGILVRKLKRFINSKLTDPAVVLMDEKMKFCIPVLSAHLGGGIDLCEELSEYFGCIPVFTTATDIHSLIGIDLFALRAKMIPDNHDGILTVNSKLLAGEKLRISGFSDDIHFPKEDYEINFENADVGFESGGSCLNLLKKSLVLGCGFHKNISVEELYREFTIQIPEEYRKRILVLTSHQKKWESLQFHEFARKIAASDTLYYGNEELNKGIVQLGLSENKTVKKHMGVSHVSKPSAFLSSRGGTEIMTVKGKATKFSLYDMNDEEWKKYQYTREEVPEVLL